MNERTQLISIDADLLALIALSCELQAGTDVCTDEMARGEQ